MQLKEEEEEDPTVYIKKCRIFTGEEEDGEWPNLKPCIGQLGSKWWILIGSLSKLTPKGGRLGVITTELIFIGFEPIKNMPINIHTYLKACYVENYMIWIYLILVHCPIQTHLRGIQTELTLWFCVFQIPLCCKERFSWFSLRKRREGIRIVTVAWWDLGS